MKFLFKQKNFRRIEDDKVEWCNDWWREARHSRNGLKDNPSEIIFSKMKILRNDFDGKTLVSPRLGSVKIFPIFKSLTRKNKFFTRWCWYWSTETSKREQFFFAQKLFDVKIMRKALLIPLKTRDLQEKTRKFFP